MQINYNGVLLEVYAVYWAEHEGSRQRMHMVIPHSGYPGLIAVSESECEMVDPTVTDFTVVKDTKGDDALTHKALQERDLLERMIEHEPGASEEFLQAISEGQRV